jgi:hypothetical protein
VRAGVTRVTSELHNLGALTTDKSAMLTGDPAITLTTISLRLGWIFYFSR